MTHFIGKADGAIVGLVIAGVFLCVVIVAIAATNVREYFYPKAFMGRFRKFVGKSLKEFQTYDKSFPGYDLATVHRALGAFFKEDCAGHEMLGALMAGGLRELLNAPPDNYLYKAKPDAPSFTRVPVGLDHEESLMNNCVYLAELRGEKGAEGADDSARKIILMMRVATAYADYDEEMEQQAAPSSTIQVIIACKDRGVADRFFDEFDRRRQELSVYRGQVIDPVVTPGGIKTIAFKRIHAVKEEDLILPGSVTSLIHGSIVGFYRNQDALRSLGVEMKRGILFHSPPGTGKTSISLYLAGLLPKFTVCFVSGRRLLYPRELCSMARYLQPTMLVFEDIDLIAQERDTNGLATVLGELMNQIDGCEPNDQVLFIMNTNSMERIETAVRNRPGRVDQIIHVPLPDLEARRKLLTRFSRNLRISPEEIMVAAEGTDGATPALLKEIVKRAAVRAVERHDPKSNGASNGAPLAVSGNDLLVAYEQVQQMRPNRALSSEVL